MDIEQSIMNIKCQVASAEYKLATDNRPGAKADLRQIRKLIPTVTGKLTVSKKPIRRSTK